MEGTITVVNDPREKHPELREAIDKVIKGIADLKIDGYDIRVTFVEHNRVHVDVNPIGVSDELSTLIKFLDNAGSGYLARTGMSDKYFYGYFAVMFWNKVANAYPTEDFSSVKTDSVEEINRLLTEKELGFTLEHHTRPYDDSDIKFFWIIPDEKEKKEK